MHLRQCRAQQPTCAQPATAIYLKLQLVQVRALGLQQLERELQQPVQAQELVREQRQPVQAQQQLAQELQQPVQARRQRLRQRQSPFQQERSRLLQLESRSKFQKLVMALRYQPCQWILRKVAHRQKRCRQLF
jgi:polyhydroxyalkanoate synthesis regulator protein